MNDMHTVEVAGVSVVMPVLNGAMTIGAQLEALAAQTYSKPWELIVSDNGCTDETVTIVREWEAKLPCLRIVDASDRRGRDHACNGAVRVARGSIVLFCDADDVVDRAWIEVMASASDLFDLWGGPIDTAAVNVGRPSGKSEDPLARESLPDGNLRFLSFVPGCNMAVIRERFVELGGFDESYSGNCEDLDLSWRAQLAGLRIGSVTGATLFRRVRPSAWAIWKQHFGYAVALPEVYRRFRVHGMRRDRLWAVARDWMWLAIRLPSLPFTPRWRRTWARIAGSRSGRLVGSTRHRVVYL